ncbi:MAG TPA: hypothetical protein VIU82_21830 [Bosea sp. (in: a-proteobacteria)]
MSAAFALLAPYWQEIAGLLAVLAAGLGIYGKGRSDGVQKSKVEDLSNANAIRKAGADARAGADAGGVSNDGWRRD